MLDHFQNILVIQTKAVDVAIRFNIQNGKDIQALQKYKTPAALGHFIMKSENPSEVADAENHSVYKSGVGMLLCLVKFSKPEISNAVREAAKVNYINKSTHEKSL
jgi:hypothetical protein